MHFTTCLAIKNIEADRAALGGITVGSSANYIKSICGEPKEIKTDYDKSKNLTFVTWYYGDTFQIRFVNETVASLTSSGNNGLTTPDGVGVGMKKSVMRSTYGKPAQVDKYNSRAIYSYNVDNRFNMLFLVRNGIISEIRIF